MDIAGCDLMSGDLVEELDADQLRRAARWPAVRHAEHPRGQATRQRNRRGPANLYTRYTRTFPPPPAHASNTRTRTYRQTYAGACTRARDAGARSARKRFARTGGHHVAELQVGSMNPA